MYSVEKYIVTANIQSVRTPHTAPICISSPVRRSGTTLVQRLLCSASNALIYGENCANDLNILTNLLSSKQMIFQQGKAWRNQQLESVLEGNVNHWIPDLMPDIDGYLEAYQQSIFSLLAYYSDFAQRQERPIWGTKFPEWNPANLIQIRQILPSTKIIYIHRNIEDCVRSAKRMDMIRSMDEIQRFCQTWKQFSEYALQHLKGERVLHIQYEKLIEAPEKVIQQLEAFTEAKDIDRKVMQIKVNTYDNDVNDTLDNYLQPASLNAQELDLVKSYQPKEIVAA